MNKKMRAAMLAAGICSTLGTGRVLAVEFKNDYFEGSFNSTVGVAAGMRAKNPSCGLVGDPNYCASAATDQWAAADNGNLNYRKHDLFTLAIKGSHELLLKNDAGLKFFTRGIWKEDFRADHTARTDLSGDARKQIVHNAELLDFWASKDFQIGEQNARVRLGNQVISWGESLYYIGGISNNVLDYQKLLVPGTQMKEAFLPVPAISLSSSLGDTLSGEAFYQFRWRRSRIAPVGSYFSASDIYNKGRQPISYSGQNFNVFGPDANALTGRRSLNEADALAAMGANGDFAIPINADKTPRNGGQYGMSLKWAPEGTQLNLGLYANRYHDQFPVLDVVGGTNYLWRFLEDRTTYGATANFPVGNWAVGVELSYRPKDAVTLSGCYTPGGPTDVNVNPNPNPTGDCPAYMDSKKYQASVTGLYQMHKSENPAILGLLGADTAFFTGEAAVSHYPGVRSQIVRDVNGVQVLQVPAAGYFTALDRSGAYPITAGIGTPTSWGYTLDFNWTYDGSVISGWQVTPGVTFSHAVKGDTPNYSAQFLEGNKSVNLYVLFNQNPTKWQLGANFTSYFGGKNDVVKRQYLGDRNFIGAFANYTF